MASQEIVKANNAVIFMSPGYAHINNTKANSLTVMEVLPISTEYRMRRFMAASPVKVEIFQSRQRMSACMSIVKPCPEFSITQQTVNLVKE